MKNFLRITLLFVVMLLIHFTSFSQTKDVASYATTNGILCENLWEISRLNGHFTDHHLAENFLYIRAATIYGDKGNEKIVFAWSKPYSYENTSGEIINDYMATLIFMNLYTGEMEKEITLKYNDEPITGLLCANDIGVDDAGNLWISSYVNRTDNETTPLKVYIVTDIENGICETRWNLVLPANESSTYGRIDHIDIVGDITGQTMDAICMASLNATNIYVYRWKLHQGDTEWKGDFDGKVCWDIENDNIVTFPEFVTAWSTSECSIAYTPDEDNPWDYFYIDGFTTCPSLYFIDLSYYSIDGFINASELAPTIGAVGDVVEFRLGDENFVAYAKTNYKTDPGCQVGIATLTGYSFENMQEYWLLPANGLGSTTDNGTRFHSIATINVTDSNGKEGVYLMTYKINNGVAVYLISQENFSTDIENINSKNIISTETARYDIYGRQLTEPTKGINIIKMSDGSTHKVLIK